MAIKATFYMTSKIFKCCVNDGLSYAFDHKQGKHINEAYKNI